MMRPVGKPRDALGDTQDRARQERLDVLAGTRGNEQEHALRRRDLDGDIADLIQRMIVAELDRRGL